MGDRNEGVPSNEQVRLIFKDTYNFYTKWIAVKDVNLEELLAEARSIECAYPFSLCRQILVETIAIIESNIMKEVNNIG